MARYFQYFAMAGTVSFSSFAVLFHLVLGSQDAFFSVQAPVTYVVAGRTLLLDCIVNGTDLSTGRVSWKHDGEWLHNLTRRSGTKVQLVITKITPQQHGIYHCSVFNFSGQSRNDDIPQDANVTVLVGGPITRPQCESNGKIPPKISLIWNIMENHQSELQFTYNVLYCHTPSLKNRFCLRPPFGYNTFTLCSDLSSNSSISSSIMQCNVTSLFKMLFPNLFEFGKKVRGRPSIFFVLNFGNVKSDTYSPVRGSCNALQLVRCTKPDNIRVSMSMEKGTVALLWDAPKDLELFPLFQLHYLILFAADGADKNQTVDFAASLRGFHKEANLRYDFTSLQPYTLYHIYIACSLTPLHGDVTRGEYIGPFSVRTPEEVSEKHA